MNKKSLPIAEPCHADWETMSGDEARRFCGSCSKHVHHLSAMTRREAHRLLRSDREESLCVRYAHDDAGELLFARRRVRATAPRRQREGAARLVAGAAMIASMVGACAWPIADVTLTGDIAAPTALPAGPNSGEETATANGNTGPSPGAIGLSSAKPEGSDVTGAKPEGSGDGPVEPPPVEWMGEEPVIMGDIAFDPDQVLLLQEEEAAEQLGAFGIVLEEEEHVDGERCDGVDVEEAVEAPPEPQLMGRIPMEMGQVPVR